MEGSATFVAHIAAITETCAVVTGCERRASRRTSHAEVVRTLPTWEAGRAAIEGAAAAVSDGATAVLSALWGAGERRAGRRYAQVIHAGLARDASGAVDAIAAAVTDGFTVFPRARAARDGRDTGRTTLA